MGLRGWGGPPGRGRGTLRSDDIIRRHVGIGQTIGYIAQAGSFLVWPLALKFQGNSKILTPS